MSDLNKKLELQGSIVFDDAEINTITPDTGNDFVLQAVSGKDVLIKLTDAAGARALKLIDSGDAEVFIVDSDGKITATQLTGSLIGDIVSPADAAHDYSAGHADWTLSATEKKAALLVVSNADTAANIIGPAENRQYTLRNASGQTITIKKSGGTGVAVANGKTAVVRYSSSVADYVRVTADATH